MKKLYIFAIFLGLFSGFVALRVADAKEYNFRMAGEVVRSQVRCIEGYKYFMEYL